MIIVKQAICKLIGAGEDPMTDRLAGSFKRQPAAQTGLVQASHPRLICVGLTCAQIHRRDDCETAGQFNPNAKFAEVHPVIL